MIKFLRIIALLLLGSLGAHAGYEYGDDTQIIVRRDNGGADDYHTYFLHELGANDRACWENIPGRSGTQRCRSPGSGVPYLIWTDGKWHHFSLERRRVKNTPVFKTIGKQGITTANSENAPTNFLANPPYKERSANENDLSIAEEMGAVFSGSNLTATPEEDYFRLTVRHSDSELIERIANKWAQSGIENTVEIKDGYKMIVVPKLWFRYHITLWAQGSMVIYQYCHLSKAHIQSFWDTFWSNNARNKAVSYETAGIMANYAQVLGKEIYMFPGRPEFSDKVRLAQENEADTEPNVSLHTGYLYRIILGDPITEEVISNTLKRDPHEI